MAARSLVFLSFGSRLELSKQRAVPRLFLLSLSCCCIRQRAICGKTTNSGVGSPARCFTTAADRDRVILDCPSSEPGPSLARGRIPHLTATEKSEREAGDFDRNMFTRIYDVTAIRVPAEQSGDLVRKLNKYLLSWPRVKNVVRVAGDEPGSGSEEPISGPGLSKDKKVGGGRGSILVQKEQRGEAASVVRVVQGMEKDMGRATRLLLLDEKYANKCASEMPLDVQEVLSGYGNMKVGQLVRCELILSYDYWHVNEVVGELLPPGLLVPSAFETVGHIAHLNLRSEHFSYRHVIARVILDKHWPKIRSVVNKLNAIHNTYRTMELEVLAGDSCLVTIAVEHGLLYHVDLSLVYWNSRLATERQRLVQQFKDTDVVCDVFAGVGPITIAAAKKARKVFANDLNPLAVTFLRQNAAQNRVAHKVEAFNMDGREFIKKMLGAGEQSQTLTQVVMNLPTDAAEFLDAFKDTGARNPVPRIHVYGFSKSPEPEEEFIQRVVGILGDTPKQMEAHRVRLVAPGKWMLCLSFHQV